LLYAITDNKQKVLGLTNKEGNRKPTTGGYIFRAAVFSALLFRRGKAEK
jgi:hypothetical protein